MTLLITGGLGYIGSHLAIDALNSGYDIFIIDDLSNSSIEVLKRIEHIANRKVGFKQCSINDLGSLKSLFLEHNFSAILHLAGLKSVAESVKSPLLYYQVNVIGTLNLLECVKAHEINRFIFSSSATVYGPPSFLPYSEDHPLRPTNPYGNSKLMSEKLLEDYAKATPRFECAALRYFNPIGAHSSGLLADAPKGTPANLLPYLVQVARKQRTTLNVFGDDYDTQDGSGVRDYIHVVDLARGHLQALNYLEENTGFHCFNLGSGQGYSVFEVIKAFEETNGIKVPFKISKRRAGDLAAYWASAEKARQKLKWQTSLSLADMVRDSWRSNIL